MKICNICGEPITTDEIATADADGAPAHEWCVEDLAKRMRTNQRIVGHASAVVPLTVELLPKIQPFAGSVHYQTDEDVLLAEVKTENFVDGGNKARHVVEFDQRITGALSERDAHARAVDTLYKAIKGLGVPESDIRNLYVRTSRERKDH
jgi:hypothetical protein